MIDLDALSAIEANATGGIWEAEHSSPGSPPSKTHPYNSALIITIDGERIYKLHHSVENTEFVAAFRMNAKELLRLARIGLECERERSVKTNL
jgi:hypothetical protein